VRVAREPFAYEAHQLALLCRGHPAMQRPVRKRAARVASPETVRMGPAMAWWQNQGEPAVLSAGPIGPPYGTGPAPGGADRG